MWVHGRGAGRDGLPLSDHGRRAEARRPEVCQGRDETLLLRGIGKDMATALSGIRACVFDAYGTLFDYASAAAGCRDVLGDRIGPLTGLLRDKQLQYTWLRALQPRHADFWQVTGDALDFALETLGLDDPPLQARLMDLYRSL